MSGGRVKKGKVEAEGETKHTERMGMPGLQACAPSGCGSAGRCPSGGHGGWRATATGSCGRKRESESDRKEGWNVSTA